MSRILATVVAATPKYTRLIISKSGYESRSCANGGCSTGCRLWFGNAERCVDAAADANLRPGQRVWIDADAPQLLQLSLRAFALPLMLFVLAVTAGGAYFAQAHAPWAGLATLLIAVAAGAWMTRRWSANRAAALLLERAAES